MSASGAAQRTSAALPLLLLLLGVLQLAAGVHYPTTAVLPHGSQARDPLFRLRQWEVDPDNGLLSILMPVMPNELEKGYLRNHLRTYAQFFDAASIKEFIITTPWDQVEGVRNFLEYEMVDLPSSHRHIRVVSDGECAEQLQPHTKYDVKKDIYPGWVKQQLVKLACAKIITTPWYLVMDTDVLYVKPLTARQLFRESACTSLSVVCDHSLQVGFQALNDIYPLQNRSADQSEWMKASAETLKLQVPMDWRLAIGVTPQILARDISLQLGEFIEDRFAASSWTEHLMNELHLRFKRNYTALGEHWNPPWTEYDLYWIFASHACVFENWHVVAILLQEEAIWGLSEFDNWRPCETTFLESTVGFFNLVQSRMKLPAEQIWDKVAPCMPHHHVQRRQKRVRLRVGE